MTVNGSVLATAGGGGGAGRTTSGFDGGEYVANGAVYDTNKYRSQEDGEASLGDGSGSSGGSGSHGGKAGENTLHEHTDACYSDEWVRSGGGDLPYEDSNGGIFSGGVDPATHVTIYKDGGEVDVSDQKEVRLLLEDGGTGGYSWGSMAATLPNEPVQNFWITDQNGTEIWRVNLPDYLRSNGTIIDVYTDTGYINWPNESNHPNHQAYEDEFGNAMNRGVAAARARTPDCYCVKLTGMSFQIYKFNYSTNEFDAIWDGTADRVIVHVLFNVPLPEGTTKIRVHYELKMPSWRAYPDKSEASGVWCDIVLRAPEYRKVTCGYSHKEGGTMGENKGAYGGTSTAYRGVLLSSSAGINTGSGYITCEEVPLNIIVKYSNYGTISGSMPDTSVSGNLSEANVTLSQNQYVKTGYSFLGWSLTQGGGVNVANGATINLSKSPYATYLDHSTYGQVVLTLYPVFEVNKYKLYFNMGDPRNSDNASVAGRIPQVFAGYLQEGGRYYKEVTYGQQIGALPDPSLIGWSFSGWYLENKRKIVPTDTWVWTSSVEVTP